MLDCLPQEIEESRSANHLPGQNHSGNGWGEPAEKQQQQARELNRDRLVRRRSGYPENSHHAPGEEHDQAGQAEER